MNYGWMFKYIYKKTDNYDGDKLSLFPWQIFAINKRSYETTRHILVIIIEAGMGDINCAANKEAQ